MADTTYSYVYYFVPLDGDTEDHMNVFLIRKPASEVTVNDVESMFPLPGRYFFRFKQPFQKSSHVWMDCGDSGDRRAPLYQGRIVCKVTRLSATSEDVSAGVGSAAATDAAAARAPPAGMTHATTAPVQQHAGASHRGSAAQAATAAAATQPQQPQLHRNMTAPATSSIPEGAPAHARAPSTSSTGSRGDAAASPGTRRRLNRRKSGEDLLGLFSMPAADAEPSASTGPTPFSPTVNERAADAFAAAPAPSAVPTHMRAPTSASSMGSVTSLGSIGSLSGNAGGRHSPAGWQQAGVGGGMGGARGGSTGSASSGSNGVGGVPQQQQRGRSPVAPAGNILTSKQGVNMW